MSLGIALSLKGAEFRYPGAVTNTIHSLDLEIRPGEWVVLLGSNGSGKSTLLNILGILDNYDTGDYFLNEMLIKNLSEK